MRIYFSKTKRKKPNKTRICGSQETLVLSFWEVSDRGRSRIIFSKKSVGSDENMSDITRMCEVQQTRYIRT